MLNKYGGTGLIFEKTVALLAELSQRAEAATSSYFAGGDFLQCSYSVLLANNHQKFRSRCLVHEVFPSYTFFNDINRGYRAAISTKNYLWLLSFFMAVATSYYLKVRRTMRTAIVSFLLKWMQPETNFDIIT